MNDKSKKFYYAPIKTLLVVATLGALMAIFAPPLVAKIIGLILVVFPVFLLIKTTRDLVLEIDEEKINFVHDDAVVYFKDVKSWNLTPGGSDADIIYVTSIQGKTYSVQSFNSGSISSCLNKYISDKELTKQVFDEIRQTKGKQKWKSWFKNIRKK